MANVKLVLLDDVENLGLAGEEVQVAPGYARNYLLPRGLAAKATRGALRLIESRKVQIAARREKEKVEAKELAVKLAGIELSIPMQATEDEQLFGSVTARVISETLAGQGFSIDHNRIKMEPIKALGTFEVEVKLPHDITATLKVWVVRS